MVSSSSCACVLCPIRPFRRKVTLFKITGNRLNRRLRLQLENQINYKYHDVRFALFSSLYQSINRSTLYYTDINIEELHLLS